MTHIWRIYSVIILVCAWTFNSAAQIDTAISPEAFGALPEVANVQISPDGSKILMLRNINGKYTLVSRELNGSTKEHIIKYEEGYYNWAIWVSNDRILASVRYRGHEDRLKNLRVSSQRRLLSMNWDGTDSIDPHRFRTRTQVNSNFVERVPQFQDRVIDILKDDPDHILIQMDIREPGEPGVYKLNIKTKKRTRVLQRRRAVNFWMTDHNHNVRYGEGRTTRRGREESLHRAFYRKSVDDSWLTLFEYDEISDKRPFYFEGFSKNPNIIYITANDENDKLSLFSYDVDSKTKIAKLASDEVMDIVDVSINEDLEIERYSFYREKPKIVRLTERGKKLDKIIEKHFPGMIAGISSESKDKNKIILSVEAPASPETYYFVDIENGDVRKVAETYGNVNKEKLSQKDPIYYSARDGLEIPGYLTLPKNSGGQNLPTVILPHGGPMDRDGWDFEYWVQFLSARGYAVLQMNYRGSTGYGEEYRLKGYHEWGRKMLEDINDGTRYMIEKGYADPDRICIMGGSYGGYAALQSIVMNEHDYKCAISYAPITDLPSLLYQYKDVYGYQAYRDYIESDEWSIEEASPKNNTGNINVPVLLMHGSEDLNVSPYQSRAFYDRMEEANKDIKYIEFENGDHFLTNEQNRIQFLKEVEIFLEKHLN